jgi:hypothetical protein
MNNLNEELSLTVSAKSLATFFDISLSAKLIFFSFKSELFFKVSAIAIAPSSDILLNLKLIVVSALLNF